MCGRYSLSGGLEQISDIFEVSDVRIEPRFNIAPTQDVPAVKISSGEQRELEFLRWGLVPSWSQDLKIGARLINARAETVSELPSFRDAFRRRRCLIPADGYFEWKQRRDGKQPFLHRDAQGGLFAFAGLWETWRNPQSSEIIRSCAIITTHANEKAAQIHHRMPVILDRPLFGAWLNPAAGTASLISLLQPCPDERLEIFPVGRQVNNVYNDSPDCLRRIELGEEPPQASTPTLFEM